MEIWVQILGARTDKIGEGKKRPEFSKISDNLDFDREYIRKWSRSRQLENGFINDPFHVWRKKSVIFDPLTKKFSCLISTHQKQWARFRTTLHFDNDYL